LTPDLAGPTIAAAAGGGDPCVDDADPNKPI
jgi:hypothetical protein